jgi:aryl-alcohol dehydrogenase-like predicted oxidoreductase
LQNKTSSAPRPFGVPDLSKYVYGTTRLGDGKIPIEDRIKMARTAMEAGVWFHTSRQYGDALEVLGRAFNEDRSRVPRLVFKIGNNNLAELRANIREQLEPLGVDHMDAGQLCLGGEYAEEFRRGGTCYADFRRLKEEGLVRHFFMEVFPWTSDAPYEALKAGHTDGIIDAFIFYLNPLQRFAANRLWNLIAEKGASIIAMRTVCGAPVHALRDVPGAAWAPYLQARAVEVAPIFDRSGITDWPEFCVRFAFSFSQVRATVGSTSHRSNLDAFLRAASRNPVEPLPAGIVDDLLKLQRRWSDETDIHAKPWTM